MDLFGKKARVAQAFAEAQLEVALGWIADLQDRLDHERSRIEIYQGSLDRVKADNIKLARKCDELQAAVVNPVRRMSASPLYKSEEEEELEFALRNGDIDLNQFKELMASQGFENTEVEIPSRPERPQLSY